MLEFVGEQAIERIVETDLTIPSLALSHACALPLERSRWHALQSRLARKSHTKKCIGAPNQERHRFAAPGCRRRSRRS
jgi:hypothetical protein